MSQQPADAKPAPTPKPGQPASPELSAEELDRATGGDKEQRVFLRADKMVAYGDLMALMNDLRAAGYLRVALVALEADKPQ